MGAATGVLKVVLPVGEETFEWNGIPKERAQARAEFEKRMGNGQFLATVVDAPGQRSQVRSFAEIEKIEKERGEVFVVMTPALVGG